MSHRYQYKQQKKTHREENDLSPCTIMVQEIQPEDVLDLIEELAPSHCEVCHSALVELEKGPFIEGYCPVCEKMLWLVKIPSRQRANSSDWIDMAWSLPPE